MEKIITTTLGSFPKPTYSPIKDWFDAARTLGGMNSSQTTLNYSERSSSLSSHDELLFVKAAAEVIDVQVRAGVDIPTDGEVRRENYIHYHCRSLKGFDFQNLEHRVLRNGAYETDLPAIRSRVSHSGKIYSVHDWKTAQKNSPVPIKYTLPGPLTIMDTNADCFYEDRKKLNSDLAQTINLEILELAKAGCEYIQVDEPLFARQVVDALDFGIEGLERCFFGVPKEITKIVHICCGYPDHLDDENYQKAKPSAYFDLISELDNSSIDQISIEDAHCCNDLKLLQLLKKKTIIFGAVTSARSRIETVAEIRDRLSNALEYIDRKRFVVAPDCGLGLLSPTQAEQKLKNMCSAVRSL